MSITDVITAIGVVVAALTFLETLRRYLRGRFQQKAAQTREELQAIIGDCGLFLHPSYGNGDHQRVLLADGEIARAGRCTPLAQ